MKITRGTRVTVAYTFRDELNAVIDSSAQSGPMVYVHGQGAILRGIEAALEVCVSSQKLNLTLPPEQAFGLHRPELVFEAPRANLPADIRIEPGVELFSGMGDRPAFQLRVVKETETGALLDGNHPHAGKTLQVELEVLDIRQPE